MTQPLSRTPLYDIHLALGGRMVSFSGWEMPIQYKEGILAEARAVRTFAGLFDVSHMGRIFLEGSDAAPLLDWTTTADVLKLVAGQGRYTFICNESGGIIDDAIVYRLGDTSYLLICNASNRPAVWQWLEQWRQKNYRAVVTEDRTAQISMIAFQGPASIAGMDRLSPGLPAALRPFRITHAEVRGIPCLVARTGYTGEDGFEVMPPSEQAAELWQRLQET
ncbi:MAG: glycine cleavage system aminomethyltransferase GcvT, partial [Chloroflexi bacterium]|nr:glycine cleavage system aminomethyltransferase GcvT [Chloroflexota bacterium]